MAREDALPPRTGHRTPAHWMLVCNLVNFKIDEQTRSDLY